MVIRLLALPIVVSMLWSAQAQPLPNHDAFVRETRDNLARSQREQNRFAYKERRTELHTNPFGRLGTGGVIVYEVKPLENGSAIDRKLIERDGKPVLDAKVERRNIGPPPDSPRQERRTRRSGLEDSIAMLDFVLDRRETVGGRSMIVVTFKPKPDARPETSQGRIARVFAGSVWVDEAQKEVTRIEATTIDSISMGMGLVARLNEGTKATVVREHIDGNIWLPTSIRFTGQGRALLFRRLNVDQRIEWFDYKRVN